MIVHETLGLYEKKHLQLINTFIVFLCVRRKQKQEKDKDNPQITKKYPEIKVCEWLNIADLPKSSFYEWKINPEQVIDKDKDKIKRNVTC